MNFSYLISIIKSTLIVSFSVKLNIFFVVLCGIAQSRRQTGITQSLLSVKSLRSVLKGAQSDTKTKKAYLSAYHYCFAVY